MLKAASLFAAAASSGGGLSLENQIIVGSSILVVLVLIVLAALARGQVGIVPKGLGAAFEHVFDWIDGLASDMIGPKGRQYVPFLMSLFLYILVANWSGLLPLPQLTLADEAPVVAQHSAAHSEALDAADVTAPHAPHVGYEAPTVSFSTTFALAVISFFAFNFYGLKKNFSASGPGGFGSWLGHFIQPTPMLWNSMEGPIRYLLVPMLLILFLCLNVIEELARVLSLSIRLFGNISGEHQVGINLFAVLRDFLSTSISAFKVGNFLGGPGFLALGGLIWGASIFAMMLGALAGFIQAMVFMVLSLVYIAHAVADDH